MDKSWIGKPRNTIEYLNGLGQFIDFAFGNAAIGDRILCPCPKCGFRKWETRAIVQDHLICKQFPKNYLIWDLHGEKNASSILKNIEVTQETLPTEDPIDLLVNEVFRDFGHTETQPPSQVAQEEETLNDGSYVDAAKDICEKIEETLSQSTINETIFFLNDVVGKVLGKEHPGRVRCLGLRAIPTTSFKRTRVAFGHDHGSSSSLWEVKYNQLLDELKAMKESNKEFVNMLKSYMIMKEGEIPQQFAGMFSSPNPTISDAASGHILPDNDANVESVTPNFGRSTRDSTSLLNIV